VLLLAERALRRRGSGARARDERLRRNLPGVCDLLAVCLAAGVPVSAALLAVGTAAPGELGGALTRVAGLMRLGADAGRAWQGAPAVLEPLARVLRRSEASGARAAPALHSLAADVRASARAETDAAVRRAGVTVLAPLGLCFLPAFVCLGVVPLVIGIAGDVLG
jgi:pilus assembly protein TadC